MFATQSCQFADAYQHGFTRKQAAWAGKTYQGHCVMPKTLLCDLDKRIKLIHVAMLFSVATAIADVFQENAISMGSKFTKMLKICDKIDKMESQRVI